MMHCEYFDTTRKDNHSATHLKCDSYSSKFILNEFFMFQKRLNDVAPFTVDQSLTNGAY